MNAARTRLIVFFVVVALCALFYLLVSYYYEPSAPSCNYRPLPPTDHELEFHVLYDSAANPENGKAYCGDYFVLPLAASTPQILPRQVTTVASTGGQGFNFALVDGMTSTRAKPERGTNPDEYLQANPFADNLARELRSRVSRERAVDPFALLCASYEQVRSEPGQAMTAVVGISGTYLKSVSVGSVVVLVVREGEVVWESVEEFDIDFFHPPTLSSSNGVQRARVVETELQPNDAVVVASDGLLQNIARPMLAHILWSGTELAMERRAQVMTSLVSQLSLGVAPTPFSVAANVAGFDWIGGRPDDTSMLVVGLTEP